MLLAYYLKSRQGIMTTPRFYVWSTRISFYLHLARLPIVRTDMNFLLNLEIDRNLRLWNGNYDELGFLDTDMPLVSPDTDDVLAKVSFRQEDTILNLIMSDLRNLAYHVGLYHKDCSK